MINKRKNNQGVTMVEMLVYIAILSIVVLTSVAFVYQIVSSRVKSHVIAEVEQQGAQAVLVIAQTIRNAEAITSPLSGSATALTLDVVDAGDDPTVFDLDSERLRITEGLGAPVYLTNDNLVASDLSFQNVSNDDTAGSIKFQFTLEYNNLGEMKEFNYGRIFYGSASLRK